MQPIATQWCSQQCHFGDVNWARDYLLLDFRGFLFTMRCDEQLKSGLSAIVFLRGTLGARSQRAWRVRSAAKETLIQRFGADFKDLIESEAAEGRRGKSTESSLYSDVGA